jgi:hypothetical protein
MAPDGRNGVNVESGDIDETLETRAKTSILAVKLH